MDWTLTGCNVLLLLQAPQIEDNWSKVFDKYADGTNKMDAKQLTHALNALFRTSM